MTVSVLDTNVLVRLLVNDHEEHCRIAASWFEEAERGSRIIIIEPVVIAEVSFVLESFYKKTRTEIASALEVIVSQRWLRVEERNVLLSLWNYYRKGLHFVDSYICAWTEVHGGDVLTFDRDLRRLSG